MATFLGRNDGCVPFSDVVTGVVVVVGVVTGVDTDEAVLTSVTIVGVVGAVMTSVVE